MTVHDQATVEHCRDLYVNQDLSYEQVTERTGVSKPTICKWSRRGGWQQQRLDMADLKGNVQKLVSEVAKKALDSKDAQDIYAFSNLLRASQVLRGDDQKVDMLAMSLVFLKDLMDYLSRDARDAEGATEVLMEQLDGFGAFLKAKYTEA